MDEEILHESLRRAYGAPPLTAGGRAHIRSQVRTASRAHRLVWRYAVVMGGIVALGFLGVPIARANYLGYSLSKQLLASKAFTVTITISKQKLGVGEHIPTTPLIASVADGLSAMRKEGSDTFYLFDRSRMTQFSPRDGKAIIRPADSAFGEMLSLPDRVAEQVGKFAPTKQVELVGSVRLNGRPHEEWRVDTGRPFGKVLLDVDTQSGLPTRMVLGGGSDGLGEVFDYDRDEAKARKSVGAIASMVHVAPQLNLVTKKAALAREISATPATAVDLPRDRLAIYRIERNAHGDVFVLYSCNGKHADEQNMGNWLRLRDSKGTVWLSDVIDLSFSKLKLNGQFPKAQVFFHPSGTKSQGPVSLFAQMIQGEFVRDDVRHPESSQGSTPRPFGTFTPKATGVGQPDWFYCAFSPVETGWLDAEPLKLRFLHAMNRGDYRVAQRLGRQLDNQFPDMMTGFFYERLDLYLSLYKAYVETKDDPVARLYLGKAIAHERDSGDSDLQRILIEARKKENL